MWQAHARFRHIAIQAALCLAHGSTTLLSTKVASLLSQLGVWHTGQQWTAPAYKEPAREGTSIHPISSVPLSPILPPTILTFVFIHSPYIHRLPLWA